MNTVYFKNDGLIDLTAVTTFGVNAKETDNPFGFFGTGLKYAIAILLRNGHEITIYRGTEAHKFTMAEKTIRDKPFKIVCMDDRELGFTLDLGKTWEMWQVFRELYCNTMDEDGEVTTTKQEPTDATTTIVIKGEQFFDEYSNRSKTILGTEPAFSLNGVDAHVGPSTSLYYRTIRVAELERPAHFSYNITQPIGLTEDRTAKDSSHINRIIRYNVTQGDNESFMREFISAPDDTYEAKVDMDWGECPSDLFMSIMSKIDFKKVTNPSLFAFYRKHANERKTPEPAVKTDIEIMQLEKAINFCKELNFPVDKYRINVTEDLKSNVLGMAYGGEIYLARRTFMQGTKQVAATVLEEYLHLEHKYRDETYEFQTYLFDVIVSLGERLRGEPI